MTYQRHNLRPGPRAFSLVEILVVISVLVLLVAILVPSLDHARQVVKIKTAESMLATIEGGLEQFRNDTRAAAPPDGYYPPSSGGSIKDDEPWHGKVPNNEARYLLTVFLVGWLDDEEDDNKPCSPKNINEDYNITEDDGVNGWGVRFNSRGRVYGPYNGLQNAPMEKNDDQQAAFVDPFGNDVYYYRYDDRTGQKKYHENHNSGGPSQDYLDELEKSRRDYILITAGPDGEFGDPTSGDDDTKDKAKDNISNVD